MVWFSLSIQWREWADIFPIQGYWRLGEVVLRQRQQQRRDKKRCRPALKILHCFKMASTVYTMYSQIHFFFFTKIMRRRTKCRSYVRTILRRQESCWKFHHLVQELKDVIHNLMFRYFRMSTMFSDLVVKPGPHLARKPTHQYPFLSESRWQWQ